MFIYKLVQIMPKILHLNFKGHSLWQSLGKKSLRSTQLYQWIYFTSKMCVIYNRNICSVCIQAGLRPDDNTHAHGLRAFLSLGRQFGQINFGAFEVF